MVKIVEIKTKGLLARVLLHEIDHLNGKLIIDYMPLLDTLRFASKGRIDKYGYYLDREGSGRVAVSPYYVFFGNEDLALFMNTVRNSEDPYHTISKKGQ